MKLAALLFGLVLTSAPAVADAAEPKRGPPFSVDVTPGLVVVGNPERFGRLTSFVASVGGSYDVLRLRGESLTIGVGPRLSGRWIVHDWTLARPTGGGALDAQVTLCYALSAGSLCASTALGVHVTKIMLPTAIGRLRFNTAGLDLQAGLRYTAETIGVRAEFLWLAIDSPVESIGALGMQVAGTVRF